MHTSKYLKWLARSARFDWLRQFELQAVIRHQLRVMGVKSILGSAEILQMIT